MKGSLALIFLIVGGEAQALGTKLGGSSSQLNQLELALLVPAFDK
jgi:hypothetical protein